MIVAIAATIAILSLFVAAAAAVARSLEIDSSPWPYSGVFMSPRLPDRPRGIQEEDLPPFVFHSEADALGPTS